MLLGPRKSTVMCPFCNIAVETTVKYYATTRTHIAAALCLSMYVMLLQKVTTNTIKLNYVEKF